MTEQKFTHTVEDASRTYFDAAKLKSDLISNSLLVSMLPKAVSEGYKPEEIFQIWNHGINIDYLTSSVTRKDLAKLVPENLLRYQLAYFTQKGLSETDIEILKAQLAPTLGIKGEQLQPISVLEERKRNLEQLKGLLLAQLN